MLLGLPINSKTVNGPTNIEENITEQLLSRWLTWTDMKGQSIKLKWLKDNYSGIELAEESPEHEKLIKTRF